MRTALREEISEKWKVRLAELMKRQLEAQKRMFAEKLVNRTKRGRPSGARNKQRGPRSKTQQLVQCSSNTIYLEADGETKLALKTSCIARLYARVFGGLKNAHNCKYCIWEWVMCRKIQKDCILAPVIWLE